MHASWTFPGGAVVDGLIGQSYRTEKDNNFNYLSGLQGTVSDIVSHLSFTPGPYFDITTRQRFDHRTLQMSFSDVTTSMGPQDFRLYASYLHSNTNPYFYYDNPPANFVNTPRNEVALGGNTKIGAWKFNADVRRDLVLNKFVGYSGGATYEDECFIFDARYYRRYTSLLNDNGDSGLLFTITLKTVGAFGFHAE
jgi:LPS-assembly protein